MSSENSVQDLYGPLTFGPHAVGFQNEVVLDRSRTFSLAEVTGSPPGRPLHMAVWYPAEKGGTAMTYRAYVNLLGSAIPSRPQGSAWAKQQFRNSLRNLDEHLPGDQLDVFLNAPVRARRDAPKAQGSFPTVFYYAGGSVHPNATFCEYLASHGFVVVSLQAPGTYTRRSRGGDPKRVAVMLRDLEFRMGYLSEHWPQADPSRLGVVAFSFSGTVGVLAAMKHPRIKTVITIDPYEMYDRGQPAFQATPDFHAPDFQIPMLTLYSSQRWEPRDQEFLPKLPFSNRTVILIDSFNHIDFLTTGRCYKIGRTPPRMARLAAANAAIRVFLEAHLKTASPNPQSLPQTFAKLDPGSAFTITRLSGKPAAVHSVNLAAMIAIGEDLPAIQGHLNAAKKLATEEPFYREDFINWMASQALRDQHHELASMLYAWVVDNNPKNAAAHTGLGQVYQALDQREAAMAAYQRALEINPNAWRAKNGLKRLEKPEP